MPFHRQIPAATDTKNGLMSTGAQSFAGQKTWKVPGANILSSSYSGSFTVPATGVITNHDIDLVTIFGSYTGHAFGTIVMGSSNANTGSASSRVAFNYVFALHVGTSSSLVQGSTSAGSFSGTIFGLSQISANVIRLAIAVNAGAGQQTMTFSYIITLNKP